MEYIGSSVAVVIGGEQTQKRKGTYLPGEMVAGIPLPISKDELPAK